MQKKSASLRKLFVVLAAPKLTAVHRCKLASWAMPNLWPYSFGVKRIGEETAIQRVSPLNWQQVRFANLWPHAVGLAVARTQKAFFISMGRRQAAWPWKEERFFREAHAVQ